MDAAIEKSLGMENGEDSSHHLNNNNPSQLPPLPPRKVFLLGSLHVCRVAESLPVYM